MRLNAEFAKRAVVHASRIEWVPSPMPGVDRRMLDRIGSEVARATSVVRYGANSRFQEHAHGGGEEFLVLNGTFSDESGDYSEGCYIRNPPTSKHAPWSHSGCVILVKLHQFHPDDRTHVVIDVNKMRPTAPAERPDVNIVPLFNDGLEDVRIEYWKPNAEVKLALPGGGEFFVIEGEFSQNDEDFIEWSWLRLPAEQKLRAQTGKHGAKVWVKTGHLTKQHPGMNMARYESF